MVLWTIRRNRREIISSEWMGKMTEVQRVAGRGRGEGGGRCGERGRMISMAAASKPLHHNISVNSKERSCKDDKEK